MCQRVVRIPSTVGARDHASCGPWLCAEARAQRPWPTTRHRIKPWMAIDTSWRRPIDHHRELVKPWHRVAIPCTGPSPFFLGRGARSNAKPTAANPTRSLLSNETLFFPHQSIDPSNAMYIPFSSPFHPITGTSRPRPSCPACRPARPAPVSMLDCFI